MLSTTFSRKFVAWGLALCVLALVWGGAVVPLARWVQQGLEAREDARFALARAHASQALPGVDENHLAAARQQLASQLLSGNTEAEAAAALHALVASLLQDDGVQLDALQAVPMSEAGPLNRLSLEVKAHGTEAALMRLLGAVESAALVLSIDRAILRARDEGLGLEMTLHAYWQASAPAKQGPRP